MDTSGEWNDYSRLKWGVEHGYLYAYPQELALYTDPRQKLAVLLTDFYYVTQRFDEAARMAQRLLRGHAGPLSVRQREYVYFAMGASLERNRDSRAALEAYEKVLVSGGGTYTWQRAGLAAGKLALRDPDSNVRQKGVRYLNNLAKSGSRAPPAFEAMVVLGQFMLVNGRMDEGFAVLGSVPKEAGAYKEIANILIRMYRGEALDKISDEEAHQ